MLLSAEAILLGKPMSMLLLHEHGTVTICHQPYYENLAEVCSQADILVAAVGKAKFVTADMVKDGAVDDVGMNRVMKRKIVRRR